MEEESQVTLTIWSHSHAPPLQPPADVSFDLRRVPNPPKHIRDNYDGRSKRLREHLLHDATFANLLQSAMQEVLHFVKEREGDAVSRQASRPGQTCFVAGDETVIAPATGSMNSTACDDSNGEDYTSGDGNTDDEEAQARTVSQSTNYDADQEEPDSSSPAQSGEIKSDSRISGVSISCFCERGRHRSVAFAEELGRMAWPRTWDVSVQHRDVSGSGKKENRKGRSGRRGGKRGLAFGIGLDGDEP